MPAKRKRPSDFISWVHEYLYHRSVEASEKKAKALSGTAIRKYVKENGEVRLDDDGNEVNGNIEYRVPEPINVAGKKYYGMELRKQSSIVFDFEAAIKLAQDKGWDEDDYGHYEFIVDQDAFLVKNQQGKLSDDDLDSLLVETEPTYNLYPIEKPGDDDA